MPSKGQFAPGSLRARVEQYLTDHPGLHTCTAIADGLKLPATDARRVHKVAGACRGLWELGRATRGVNRTYGGVAQHERTSA